MLTLALVSNLALAAVPCAAQLAPTDALPDGPLSEVMPAVSQAIASCAQLPSELQTFHKALVDELKLRSDWRPTDAMAQTKLYERQPSWWRGVCAPAAGPALAALGGYLGSSDSHTLFTACRFSRLNLLSEAEFSRAKGMPLFGLLLGQWLVEQGHPLKRAQHIARAYAAVPPPEPAPTPPEPSPAQLDSADAIPPPPPPPPPKRSKKRP